VDLVRRHCAGTVLGNHDLAVVDETFEYHLPRAGLLAVRHNRERLSEENFDFLAGLPLQIEADGCTFVHATPENPAAWQRIGAFSLTQRQFDHFHTDVCFIGHTHVPGLACDHIGTVRVRRGNRYLINAGSVGRPRDGDTRATFVVFDTEAFDWELVRVRYDVGRAAAKILEAGLPPVLADDLMKGQ
jgi:diadenosine tetraphosphatase ApaH/serine/threonine PP2A family protein phosphatase